MLIAWPDALDLHDRRTDHSRRREEYPSVPEKLGVMLLQHRHEPIGNEAPIRRRPDLHRARCGANLYNFVVTQPNMVAGPGFDQL